MGNLIWKIKQTFRQLLPVVVMAALAWGGYHFVRFGGLKPGRTWSALNSSLRTFPVFGSYFRGRSSKSSYAYGGRSHRRHAARKHSRRHSRRR